MHTFFLITSLLSKHDDVLRFFISGFSIFLGRLIFIFFKNSGAIKPRFQYTFNLSTNIGIILSSLAVFHLILEHFNFDLKKTKLVSLGFIWGLTSDSFILIFLNNMGNISQTVYNGIMDEMSNRLRTILRPPTDNGIFKYEEPPKKIESKEDDDDINKMDKET